MLRTVLRQNPKKLSKRKKSSRNENNPDADLKKNAFE